MVSFEASCFVFNSYDKEVIINHRKQIEEKVLECASENGSSSGVYPTTYDKSILYELYVVY